MKSLNSFLYKGMILTFSFATMIYSAEGLSSTDVSFHDVKGYVNAGQAYNHLGQHQKAIDIYLQGLREFPADHDLVLALAYAYLFDGQAKESTSLFQEMLRTDPNSIDALVGLGAVKEATNQHLEAQNFYAQALKIDPSREDIKRAIQRTRNREKEIIGVEEKKLKGEAVQKDPHEAIPYYQKLTELNPEQAEYFYLLGVAYKKINQPEEALKAFEKANQLSPNYIDAKIALGYTLISVRKFKESQAIFDDVLSKEPQNIDALLGLASVKEALAQYIEAEKIYIRAHAIDPDRADVNEALDQLKALKQNPATKELYLRELASQKSLPEAIEIYQELIKTNPDHADNYFLLGQAYKQNSQPQLALEMLQKAVQLQPDHMDAQITLGYLYQDIHQNRESQQLFEKILQQDPKHIDALLGLGRVYEISQQSEKAKEYYSRAAAINPNREDVKQALSRIDLPAERAYLSSDEKDIYEVASKKEPAEAIPLYLKLTEINPRHADYYYLLGQAYRLTNQIALAKKALQQTLRLDRHHVDAKVNLAFIYLMDNQVKESRSLFEDILKDNPENVDALLGLGKIYELLQQNDKAKELFYHASALSPDREDVKKSLARINLIEEQGSLTEEEEKLLEMANQKAPVEAIPIYQQLLAHNPLRADYHYFLGVAYKKIGEPTLAFNAFKKAIQIQPDHHDAEVALAYLYLANQELESSEFLFQKALREHPTSTDALLGLALIKERLGLREEAEGLYYQILAIDPSHQDATHLLSRIQQREPPEETPKEPSERPLSKEEILAKQAKELMDREQYADAIVIYQQLIAKQPTQPEYLLNLGESYMRNNQREEAVQILQALLSTHPDNQDARVLLGYTYLAEQHDQEAEALFEAVLKQNPHYLDAWVGLGRVRERQGRKEDAEDIYNKVLAEDSRRHDVLEYLLRLHPNESPRHPVSNEQGQLAKEAKQALDKGDNQRAIELYLQLIQKNPKDADSFLYLGQAYMRSHQKEKAIAAFTKVLEIEPKYEDARHYLAQLKGEKSEQTKEKIPAWAEEMYKEAIALERKEKTHQALEIYAHLTERFPKNGDYRFKLGKMYLRTQQRELGRQTFFDVLKITPDYQDARAALAYMYLQDQDFNTSRMLFQIVLDHAPKHAEALAGMGRLAMLDGDLDQAELFFTQAISHDPTLEYALNFYGQVLMQENRYSEAKPLLVSLLKITPKDKIVQRTLFGLREYTDPSLGVGGIKGVEEEKDRFSGRLVARLIEWHKRYELILPMTDRFRVFGRGSLGAIRQANLISNINTFNAWLHNYALRGIYLLNPQWTFQYWAAIVSASNRSKGSFLPTLRSCLFIPGVSATYDDTHYRFNIHSANDYLLTKDFTIYKTYLIRITNTGVFFEKLYNKYQRRIGASGDYFWYQDRVNNQAFWISGWGQTGILHPYEDLLSLRYQVDYRRFKKLIPDYYTFQYQLTHWMCLRFNQTWDDSWLFEVEYWHGWRWTKGKNPSSQLITETLVDLPITKLFSYLDRVWIGLTKTMNDRLQVRAIGQMSRDSFDYTTWAIEGNAIYRF